MGTSLDISNLFRVLAPGGGFSSPLAILRTRAKIRKMQNNGVEDSGLNYLTACLAPACSVAGESAIQLKGSGTESLFSIFSINAERFKSKVVGIPAYTCPDIAAAAIRAGWRVLPLDVDERSLDIAADQYDFLDEHGVSAVVLPNLFGLVDSIKPWLARDHFLTIDDACQGALSSRDGVRLGFSQHTWGALSFGRGKAFCGPGGGAMVYPLSAEELVQRHPRIEQGVSNDIRDWLYGFLLWLVERPSLYSVPARVPGLGLGETHCEINSPLRSISEPALLHAASQASREEEIRLGLQAKARAFESRLGDLDLVLPTKERGSGAETTLLRFPIILSSSEIRNRLYKKLWAYGASCSYPSTLYSYKELTSSLIQSKVNRAENVANRILSLPLHIYVNDTDTDRIVEIIQDTLR